MRSRTLRRRLLGAAAGAIGIALAALPIPAPEPAGGTDDAWPGMAGVDTSLPPTDSKVTVRGRGAFSNMEITVSQTEDLTNQAISITWRGGEPTNSEGRTFYSNFVQVMQCWGDPDGAVPENPGPPPEQCVWGALNPTAASEIPGFATQMVTSRAFSNEHFPDFDPAIGTVDQSGDVYRDFVAVDGTVVTDHVDHTATGDFDQFWLNTYFDSVKSNEVPGVRTLSNGRGQTLFTVNTGVESSGLGCGQRVQPTSGGGEPTVPRCWLVIVPRGTPEVENEGTPFPPSIGVASSPMNPRSWRNRIAVELHFTPVDSPCDINAEQRRINGTELALAAVASWQPVLCTQPGSRPYAYGVGADGLARQQIMNDGLGAPGMVVVNRPVPAEIVREDDPVLYAPLATSAVAIGFNVERVGALGGTDDRRLQGVRYSRINLTPRLVAKLLTQSYRSQVSIRNSDPYEWDDENPIAMFSDPDFLQFNPEFTLWGAGSGKHAGGLVLPSGPSDLANQVWEWILADAEAAEWLAGEPDEWGMVVNPVYATDPERNTNGFAFGSPPPDSFPKTDPYCYQAPELASGVVPPPLCALDWFPYSSGFAGAARTVAAANDGAKTLLDLFAGVAHEAWRGGGPQALGRRTMFGVTDLPSAERFGLQTARLSRAGDNGADREFIAPDDVSLNRAVRSMSLVDGMLRIDPDDVNGDAYPLTTIAYAAIRPLALSDDDREGYAAFLEYAAGPGQEPGRELGQLPPGYVPLSSQLAETTMAVAEQVRTLEAPEEPPPTTEPPTTEPPPTTSTTSGVPAPTGSPPPAPGATAPNRVSSSGGSTTDSEGEAATPPTIEITEIATTPSESPPRRGVTPVTALGNARFAVIAVAVLALLSFLGTLEITKRPRRAPASDASAGSSHMQRRDDG